MKRIFLIQLVFWLTIFGCRAQAIHGVYPLDRETLVEVTLIDKEAGVPHWGFSPFFEDHRGLVWFQSGKTLCYYDGKRVTSVEPLRETLYDYPRVQLGEDREGNIWRLAVTASSDWEIDVYSPAKDQFTRLSDKIARDVFRELPNDLRLFSVNQTVYLTSRECGTLWRYDGDFRTGFQSDSGTLIYPGPGGQWWEIAPSGEVRLTPPGDEPPIVYPRDSLLDVYVLDKTHQLWSVTGGNRVTPLLKGTPEIVNQSTHFLSTILPATQASFTDASVLFAEAWPATDSGDIYKLIATYFNRNPNELKPGSVLPERLTRTLADEDSSYKTELLNATTGGLFLGDGSYLGQLGIGSILHLRIKKNYFANLLSSHSVRALTTQGDTNLVAVITSNLPYHLMSVNLTPEKFGQTTSPDVTVSNPSSLATLPEALWIGNVDGEVTQLDHQFNLKERYAFPGPSAPGYSEANCILPITDSTFWYATTVGVIEVDVKGKNTKMMLDGMAANWIHRDQGGKYWIGTRQGLFNLEEKKFYLRQLGQGGEAADISHIYEDHQGFFWLASKQGLIRWSPRTEYYDLYDKAAGLPSQIIHAIYPDNRGRLWLSTNNGIVAFDLSTQGMTVYDESAGLLESEHNYASHAKSKDGHLFFGSIRGVTYFHPDSIPKAVDGSHQKIVPLDLEAYDAKGNLITHFGTAEIESGDLRLPRGTDQLRTKIEHIGFYERSQKLQWRFAGDGQSEWISLDEDGELYLQGVPKGSFQVAFRTFNTRTNQESNHTFLSLYRPLPLYYQWWFWLPFLGLLIGLIKAISDYRLSTVKKANQQLNVLVSERTKALVSQKEQLEHAYDLKNKLLKNISHELRTPLTIISNATREEIAKRAPNKNLVLIQKKVKSLTKSVDNILQLSQLDAGSVGVTSEVIEWTAFIYSRVHAFKGLAEHKNIAYDILLEPSSSVYLEIDKDKVEAIINNLLSNAIKYTEAGGRIVAKCGFAHNIIELIVADSGPGIDSKEQQDIFKRFYRTTSARNDSSQGYGIGLSLVKEYVDLLKGEIGVDSTPGKGSTFVVRIPAEAKPNPVRPAGEKPGSTGHDQQNGHSLAGLLHQQKSGHILVVEDDPDLSAQLVEFLSAKYTVEAVANGQEAWEELQQHPTKYDLVLSDVMMPIMDGFALLEKTRADKVLGYIPFLMLTALNLEDSKLRALRLGVDAYMIKPYSVEELFARVDNLVIKHQQKEHLTSRTSEVNPIGQSVPMATEDESEGFDDVWLRELEEIVSENLARTDFKITDIAFQLHISERTLRNQVKKYTGHSPRSYLQKARLDTAYRYLEARKYRTVSEVAYAVGFKDAQYFSKLFQKAFGKLPSDYL